MASQIAKRPLAKPARPLHFVLGDCAHHPHRPLAHLLEVMQKILAVHCPTRFCPVLVCPLLLRPLFIHIARSRQIYVKPVCTWKQSPVDIRIVQRILRNSNILVLHDQLDQSGRAAITTGA
jgi:hypothetical protein